MRTVTWWRSRRVQRVALAVAALVVAANLRPAVASMGPELDAVRRHFGLSGGEASILTAAPVFCFGLFARTGPWLSRRWGLRPAVGIVLFVLVAGLAVRLGPSPVLLFAGTVLAAAGIAVANVLIPVIVKRDFPERTGLMMGLYTTALTAAAAAAAGLTVPFAQATGGGWRAGLGLWTGLAVIGFVVWLPFVREREPGLESVHTPASLRRNALAWQITAFFGVQALGFYATLSWLPSLFQSHGYSAGAAGALTSLTALVQIPVALSVPIVAPKLANQIPLVIFCVALTAIGLAGLLISPTRPAVLWVLILGLGQGSSFPLGTSMFLLRTRSAAGTAQISAMAQSIGYLMAGLGPLAFGALHSLTGGWRMPLGLLLLLMVPELLFGLAAARPRYLPVEPAA